jgi:hypothetical protein
MVQLEEQPEPASILRNELEARLNLACTEHQMVDHIYFVANPQYYKIQEHWLLSEEASVNGRDQATARVAVRPLHPSAASLLAVLTIRMPRSPWHAGINPLP